MKFDPKELNRVGSYCIPGIYGVPAKEVPKLDTPITPKENMLRMFWGEKPLWLPNQIRENNALCPYVMPDSYARAFGGIDWFGIDWKYEPTSFAAMVRPGTRAAKMPDQVSPQEKERRSHLMAQAVAETRAEFLRQQVGLVESVLFETDMVDGSYTGYTQNYPPVQVASSEDLRGQVRWVRITQAEADFCRGEVE